MKYIANEKIKAGDFVYLDSNGELVKSVLYNVMKIRIDTFKFDKAMNRTKHQLVKLSWFLWSSRGWCRCLRPFVRFYFWWTKPV